MKIKTIIVDDEPLAIQRVSNLLLDIKDIEIVEECFTGKKAIESINKLRPSLILMDIKLKDITGFNVLEKIDQEIKPIIIFITAFDEFAIKAFDYFALDYLLKPFRNDRFYKSIYKAIEVIKKDELKVYEDKIRHLVDYVNDENEQLNKLPVKIGNKTLFIKNQDIMYVVASGSYVEIFIENKKFLQRGSVSNLMEQLNSKYFIRIHRSTVINLNFIQELINSSYGEIDVKMNDNKLFRVSKSYKKEFLKIMGL